MEVADSIRGGVGGWIESTFGIGSHFQVKILLSILTVFHFRILETGNWVDADRSAGRIIHIPT